MFSMFSMFKITTQNQNQLHFENPEHDFPKELFTDLKTKTPLEHY